MKLFADENVEALIVEFFRQQGHDVLYAAEVSKAAPDTDVLAIATGDGRIVLTSDLDFGELVFHRQLAAVGIVLMRLDTNHPAEKVRILEMHWPAILQQMPGNFVVVTNDRIRIRRIRT